MIAYSPTSLGWQRAFFFFHFFDGFGIPSKQTIINSCPAVQLTGLRTRKNEESWTGAILIKHWLMMDLFKTMMSTH